MGNFMDQVNTLAGQEDPAAKAQEVDISAAKGGSPASGDIGKQIESHLSQIPDQQKAYLANYMTPELVNILGILLGPDAAQYFSQYADPSKALSVVPAQAAAAGGGSGQPIAAASNQPTIGLAQQSAAPVQASQAPVMGPINQ